MVMTVRERLEAIRDLTASNPKLLVLRMLDEHAVAALEILDSAERENRPTRRVQGEFIHRDAAWYRLVPDPERSSGMAFGRLDSTTATDDA